MNYIYAALVIIVGIGIAILARVVVRWLKEKAGETDTQWDDIIIAAIGTPVQVTIIVISVYISLNYFGILPGNMQWMLEGPGHYRFYVIMGAWILSSFLHDIMMIYGHILA